MVSSDPDVEDFAATYNWLGAKQNIYLFENITGVTYTEIRTNQGSAESVSNLSLFGATTVVKKAFL